MTVTRRSKYPRNRKDWRESPSPPLEESAMVLDSKEAEGKWHTYAIQRETATTGLLGVQNGLRTGKQSGNGESADFALRVAGGAGKSLEHFTRCGGQRSKFSRSTKCATTRKETPPPSAPFNSHSVDLVMNQNHKNLYPYFTNTQVQLHSEPEQLSWSVRE